MIFRKTRCIMSVMMLSAMSLYAQNEAQKYPQHYFTAPLTINPPSLSGSFGEIRGNHFHAANDYRTNQRIGYPVLAAADGYISRIKTSAVGYGNGIYISHPNGFTSVYGHLSRYAPKIEKINEAIQYQEKSFEIDTLLNKNLIPIKKGEIIGYSGNSGSSGGPHLHFEIRNTATEAPINPQLFGLTVADQVAPEITSVFEYELNEKPFDYQTKKINLALKKIDGNYVLNSKEALIIHGEVAFGLVTFDKSTDNIGKNGTYQVELFLDDDLIFASKTESFTFENSKAVNSFIDYPAYIQSKLKIQKSFIEPNNPLSVYTFQKNHGKIKLNDQKTHLIKYVVCDIKGNTSTLSFPIIAGKQTVGQNNTSNYLSYKKENNIEKEGLKINIPKNALYDDINFFVKKSLPKKGDYSDTYEVFTKFMPLQKNISISIPLNSVPKNLEDKLVAVNEQNHSYGGNYQNGFLNVNSKLFGTFRVIADTIAPKISPMNISEGKDLSHVDKIMLKISDNCAGIKSYTASIDGQWVLMEFDAKTSRLYHVFDDRTSKGKHLFELEVKDYKNNIRNFKSNFIK